ncbi:GNAT family N-acetyltransferase [Paenibacillus mucilaginosus]|uniref:GCN5-related N-acetyltransferase n=1 Tax=Paenibacillus mucilaginosus (strain KNP414) TaxID=1036673 RepID=F8FG86_PAEMK|nr:GNAT family N-acetyltransferase [Paenibacillus mucilaginosus]AEI43906.1 GCN5-related N-acetyltransferase [Paenibacillus mucilaginosus KNP414]MCG7212590.1 GNAT family N-acetyltransferase [Paenibacillus mucilaginosus]WDM25383.1 GNAT family N-acetyltransferase [Paenibacillus mucilaginosus]
MGAYGAEYRMNAPLTAAELAEVFRRSGMTRPVDDPARLQRMIEGADETVTAWDGGRLDGVARAVTDYVFCCCLSDLAVDPEYQGQGVGSRMVQLLRDKLGEEVSYVLLSAPGAVEFYPKIGFDRADKAFVIRRKR